jgi:hypothetical protein
MISKKSNSSSGKKPASSTNNPGSTGIQHVEKLKLIHSYLQYKVQVQVDQELPHKTRYAEFNRIEGKKNRGNIWHRGKFPEQNTNGSSPNINN